MMSAVGLELKNSLNDHLAWKTVKGNRSATRRTRKSVAKNLTLGAELGDKNNKRSDEGTVSESEKLGVAVLGRRFSDKMEHVPIKKRKFNIKTPSPPRDPSPRKEVLQHTSDLNRKVVMQNDASGAATSNPRVVDGKSSGALNGKFNFREDFSGIKILADAACHNAYADHAEERPVKEASTHAELGSVITKQDNTASKETADILSKDMGSKDRLEGSSSQHNTASFVQKHPTDNVDKVVENSTSVQDKDDKNVQDKDDKNVVEKSLSLQDKDASLVGNSVSVQDKDASLVGNSVSVQDKDVRVIDDSIPDDRLHWDLNVSMDAWQQPCDDVANDDSQANPVDGISLADSAKLLKLEGCEVTRETEDVEHDYVVDSVVSTEAPQEAKITSESKDLLSGQNLEDNQLAACSGPDQKHNEGEADGKSSVEVANTDGNNMVSNATVFNFLDEKAEDGTSDIKTVPAESIQVEGLNNTRSSVSVLDRVDCEVNMTILNGHNEDSVRAPRMLPDDTDASQENRDVDDCLPVSLGMQPLSKLEEVGVKNLSMINEGVLASNQTAEEVKPVDTENSMGRVSEPVSGQTTEIDCSLRVGSEDTKHVPSGNFVATMDGSGKVNIEDPSDDIYESDSSEDYMVHMAGKENSRELQGGYDSQFEDGELRESDLQGFEENEGEVADIEQVDYESECDGERLCNFETEDNTEKKSSIEDGSNPREIGEMSGKIEHATDEESLRDCPPSSKGIVVGAADDTKAEKTTVDCESGPVNKEVAMRLVDTRISKRELISPIEGSSSSDAVHRSRSENSDDMCPRLEREAGSNKFMGRDRSSCYGPYGTGRTRPRSIVEGRGFVVASDNKITEGGVAVEGVDNRVRRQYFSSSSNNVFLNRRSIPYRDEVYGMQSDLCPDRSRFRRYPQGGIRERPMPNYSNDYADHMPQQHRISRRDRSISPLGGERLNNSNYSQSYRKSRSRSRSHSPGPWLLSREQNEGGLRRSRSPFRSTRMDSRVRLQPQKPFAAAEYEEDFISPPRNRFSPQRNSRFDEQISELDNSRERKSPVRMIRQEMSYRRPMPNFSNENPNHMQPHHVGRRERSISPPLGGERERMNSYPQYKKAPRSRSRSRSPNAWVMPNDRNVGGLRRRGRSPNFRSNRMERPRLPFQKRYAAEYEEEFMSPPRNRFSPQRNPRFEGRVMDNNFRDRKSPVRMFRQGQRFDSVRSMRPMMHPRRFGDMDGSGGGGRGFGDMGGRGRGGGRGFNHNYESGDDDRRKPGNRYEMINRRRYDSDGGGVRRFDV